MSKPSFAAVLFLDFDGVLNSEAEWRCARLNGEDTPIDLLSPIACSNLQHILERCKDLKVVVSSTWRLHFDLETLRAKLYHHGVSAERLIDVTPQHISSHRGREIKDWLEDNNVDRFVVLDDDGDAHVFDEEVADDRCLSIQTDAEDGLLLSQAKKIIRFLA